MNLPRPGEELRGDMLVVMVQERRRTLMVSERFGVYRFER